MILYDLCSAYEYYSPYENITGTTYPYTTVEPTFLEEGDPPWPILAPHWIRPWADLADKQQHL